MKNYSLVAFAFLILFNSCNQIADKAEEIQHDYEFNQDISATNKIIIGVNESKNINSGKVVTSENNFLKTKNLKQVKFLDSLLRGIPKTNYCCCPFPNYSIDFYSNETKVNTYYADTLEFKDKIRIYECSYQFSFIVEKESWKNFLNELERKK